MKGLIFVKLRSYKGIIKVSFSFLKKAWAPCKMIYKMSCLYCVLKFHDNFQIFKLSEKSSGGSDFSLTQT